MSQTLPLDVPHVKAAKVQKSDHLARSREGDRPNGTAPPSHATIQRALASPQRLSATDVLQLQRSVGNQAVSQMLKRPDASPASQPAPAQMTVGPAHDRFEAEADHVAQSVDQSPLQRTQATAPTAQVQRSANVQTQTPIGPAGGTLDAATGDTIRRAQGGGRPIDAHIRAPLEQKLNTDLSHARLHVNRQADDLNQRVGARAFTAGSDIFVQRSEYQPQSKAGRSLLYHELTHVHQQKGGIQRNVIQRGISKKTAAMSGKLDQMHATVSKGRASQTQAQNYLDQFATKPQNAQARKDQKAEKKQMKSLLHFDDKRTKTSSSDERLVYRSVLAAERSRGQSMAALAELKQFMLDQGNAVPEATYAAMLNNSRSEVLGLIKKARQSEASPHLLNLFNSHNTKLISDLDKEITSLIPRVSQLAIEAAQIASTATTPVLIRLKPLATEMQRTLATTQAARTHNDFITASQTVKQVSALYDTIWNLKTYAEIGAKSNLSSDKEIGKANRLGGGQVGKVFEVNYDPAANPSIQHGAFKEEKRTYTESESPAAISAGISQDDANFGSRSVASYKVDKLMGMGVAPKTKFGTHEGMGGTVQDWAKGKSPQELVKSKDTMSGVDTRFRKLDYDDPELQRQLATLQVFDAITGQVDRHPGNYYISQGPGGTQVTAIDNDLAFGKDKDVERLTKTHAPDETLPNDHSRGVPLFLDETIADQILNTSENALKATLMGMLSPQEVSKTLVRFAKVKAELRIKKANTARIKAMQNKLDTLTQYEGRLGSKYAGMEDAIGTQVDFLRRELAKTYSKGALIDQSQWGQMTAMHLNSENSYYGLLVEQARMHQAQGKMLPDGQ